MVISLLVHTSFGGIKNKRSGSPLISLQSAFTQREKQEKGQQWLSKQTTSTILSLRRDRIIASAFELASSAVRAYSAPPTPPLSHSVCTEKGVDVQMGRKGSEASSRARRVDKEENSVAVLMTPKKSHKAVAVENPNISVCDSNLALLLLFLHFKESDSKNPRKKNE